VRLQELGAGTAIVCSDTAFLRIDVLENAIDIARSLMFELVTSEVPVRMGLEQGSYRMLRFLTDSSSHVSFHMSTSWELASFVRTTPSAAASLVCESFCTRLSNRCWIKTRCESFQ
jgi:hypothetical protein